MDKLKCPSFFKCRVKEVGVWKLWEGWGAWEGNTSGEAVSGFAFCGCSWFSTFLFNCLQVCLRRPYRVEGKENNSY